MIRFQVSLLYSCASHQLRSSVNVTLNTLPNQTESKQINEAGGLLKQGGREDFRLWPQKALLSSHHVAPGAVLRRLPKAGQEQLDRITAHIFQNWTLAGKSGNLKFNEWIVAPN